jgi:hypothetical protein
VYVNEFTDNVGNHPFGLLARFYLERNTRITLNIYKKKRCKKRRIEEFNNKWLL